MAETSASFDALIYIGRFQPFHVGHLHVVQQALARSQSVVLLLGSAGLPRSTRNPWSYEERRQMILDSLPAGELARVYVQPLADVLYDDAAWLAGVRDAVGAGLQAAGLAGGQAHPRVGLIGHDKDHSSYYLQLFPEWGSVAVDHYRGISATPLREALLRGQAGADPVTLPEEGPVMIEALLPTGSCDVLAGFAAGGAAASLQEEQVYVDRWRKAWSVAPYPPIFVTVDALVTCQNHLLLIERGRHPGRGLWALPGGFLDPEEPLLDACLRELAEETCIHQAVGLDRLRGCVCAVRVFDEPNRSARGRTVTHVHHLDLAARSLPEVCAADDAARAFWLPLDQLDPAHCFEDHYFIARSMLPGRVP